MKLVRYGAKGREKPGIIDADGKVRDLSKRIPDITADTLSPKSLDRLRKVSVKRLPLVGGRPRLGVPFTGIGKIICIGLNYSDHAAETGSKVPPEPMIFMKALSAINGPRDPIVIPKKSKKTDWEVELAIVIGQVAKYVPQSRALDHVAGYTICNDVSEREFQIERSGQFTKGKSCDSFAPIGPWLVTRDEVANPQRLNLWTEVNGKRMQDGNTNKMVFGVVKLVSYLSQFMTLHPGDIISTGTPPGVGAGMKPQTFLKPGDAITMGIEGMGEQRNRLVADGK